MHASDVVRMHASDVVRMHASDVVRMHASDDVRMHASDVVRMHASHDDPGQTLTRVLARRGFPHRAHALVTSQNTGNGAFTTPDTFFLQA
jgi:hypothetical protein